MTPPASSMSLIQSILRSTNLRRVWVSTFWSGIGDWAHTLVLSVLMYDAWGITGVSLVAAIRTVVTVLLGPPLGRLASRIGPRRAIIAGDSTNAIASAALALAVAVDLNGPYLLLTAWTLSSACTSLSAPSKWALLPTLRGDHDEGAANATEVLAFSMSMVISPILVSLLLADVNEAWLFAADAATFLISVIAVRGVTMTAQELAADDPDVVEAQRAAIAELPDAIEGHVLVDGDTRVRTTLRRLWSLDRVAFSCLAILVGGRFVAGLIFVGAIEVAADALDGGDRMYGVIISAIGLGSAAGAILSGRVREALGLRGAGLALSMSAIPVLLLGFGHGYVPLIVGGLLFSLPDGISDPLLWGAMQSRVKESLRPSVFAVIESAGTTFQFLGQLAAGVLLTLGDRRLATVVAAVVITVLSGSLVLASGERTVTSAEA